MAQTDQKLLNWDRCSADGATLGLLWGHVEATSEFVGFAGSHFLGRVASNCVGPNYVMSAPSGLSKAAAIKQVGIVCELDRTALD